MSRPLKIQYPNAPPVAPERLAMAGRVVSRYEQGEKERVAFPWEGRLRLPYCPSERNRANMAIYLLRTLRGDTLEEIERAFNINRCSSVSSVVQRMSAKISNPPPSPGISLNGV